MKIRHAINLHKALTIPVVLGMMIVYNNFAMGPYLYLSLHGTYSLLWLFKEQTYPDKRFDERQPVWIALLFVFVPLMAYWIAPFILISRGLTVAPPLAAVAVFLTIVGIFLHYVSDAQKYFVLAARKGLITDGLFARTRNPNYLGEILTYAGFAVLAQHWLPFLILAAWVGFFFVPNMRTKDRSLSRWAEFPVYESESGMLLPRLIGHKLKWAWGSKTS